MRRFEGQRALISAGADGLGRAIAVRLAEEGAEITILDLNPETIATAKADPALGDAQFFRIDLLDPAQYETVLAPLKGERFDVLVNNAGGSLHTPRPFLEESDEDWARVMGLNVDAAVRLTRLVLPGMIAAGYGRIVNLGSKAGRFGSLFTGANYVAAKGAVQSMTLQLAQEFGRNGITCNAVCPGAILTPRVERLLAERMTDQERADALKGIPVGRQGKVEDIASAVAYLASEEAGFVTGVMLDVNGGQGMVA